MKSQKNPLLTASEIKMLGIAIMLSLITVTCVNAQAEIPLAETGAQMDLASVIENSGALFPAESALICKKASFPGTTKYKDLNTYIATRLKYPKSAAEAGRYGWLKVHFEIQANGEIGEVDILQSPGEMFDRAILDLLAEMPKWKPAIEGNRPVSSGHILQLEFRLQ
jgi:TonB family protein